MAGTMSAPLTADEREFLERCVEVWEEVARAWDGWLTAETGMELCRTLHNCGGGVHYSSVGRVPGIIRQVELSKPPNALGVFWYPPGQSRALRARHARLLAARCRQLLTMEHPE